jgi:hypothetical protein
MFYSREVLCLLLLRTKDFSDGDTQESRLLLGFRGVQIQSISMGSPKMASQLPLYLDSFSSNINSATSCLVFQEHNSDLHSVNPLGLDSLSLF